VIESPARDALSLTLVLREPPADECAAAFVSGLPWPQGTSIRLVDRRTRRRSDRPEPGDDLSARLGRAGIRVIDETARTCAVGSIKRRSADLVITGGSRSGGGLRRFVAQTLAEREVPMLVARRPQLNRGLIVVDDDLSPALVDLLRREPFRRARFRVLGVFDASASWYAGVAFAPAERLESVTAAATEAAALLRAATRQAALNLSWAGVAATAHVEEGNAERTIIRVARDMAADWVVLARSVDANQAAASLVDRLIADAEASILIAPTVRTQ